MSTRIPAPPDYVVDEIRARVAYAQLPLRHRLTTMPPPGWSGAWMARIVAACVGRVRRAGGLRAALREVAVRAGTTAYRVAATLLVLFVMATCGWWAW